MHTAKVTLNCDIEYNGKIIFENKKVWFYADIDLFNIKYDGYHIEDYDIDDWNTCDETYRANRDGYLFSTILTEWCSDKEVEDFDISAGCIDFTFLVKSEEYDDVEIDYEMFEPDWDLMREGK